MLLTFRNTENILAPFEPQFHIVQISIQQAIGKLIADESIKWDAWNKHIEELLRFPWSIIENAMKPWKNLQWMLYERFSCTLEKLKSFEGHTIPIVGNNKIDSAYLRAEQGCNLILWYENIPIAYLGFRVWWWNKVRIAQIQGMKFISHPKTIEIDSKEVEEIKKVHENWYIENFEWPLVLVKVLEQFLNLLGLKWITIVFQSAFNNDYYKKWEDYDERWPIAEIEELKARMRKIYNETAKKSGYTYSELSWNYSKVI